jgi:hypothetical protein
VVAGPENAMKKLAITAVVALCVVGCGKDEAPAAGATGAPSAKATAAATAKAAAAPSAAPSAAPTAAPSAAPAAGGAQKGVPEGKVVVGYIQDNADPSQCAAVCDAPAKKEAFTKDAEKFAQMVKGKVVPSCPMDAVVGTCNAGFGMLVNYSGPKWTAETAKKDCTSKPHQKWVE